jgi:hypothetical protein
MRTLVYLASGGYNEFYETLPFDRIYLVSSEPRRKIHSEKVVYLNMDALDSIEYFKENNISIACLVTLRESQGEGGFRYNLCSDAVMGYLMPILQEQFIWICNGINYYKIINKQDQTQNLKLHKCESLNYVSLDLPYIMTELNPDSHEYIDPAKFTDMDSKASMHIFSMQLNPVIREIRVGKHLNIRLIQDSIWRHADELDQMYISFKPSHDSQKDFYTKHNPKAFYYRQMEFGAILRKAIDTGLNHIGFTPHYWYQYDKNYQKMLEQECRFLDRDLTIDFYYMNSWFNCRHIEKAIKTLSI